MKLRLKYGPGDTKCEPCAVNEIDADAAHTVSGEPWCAECIEMNAMSCDRCDNFIDAEDSDHGDGDETYCHDCGHA